MPRPGKRVKHARRIVAARLPNHEPDAATTNEIENDEWLDDSAVVDEAVVEDNISAIRWTPGAKPRARKSHDGFGRSSTFARKAKMKKMQVHHLLSCCVWF